MRKALLLLVLATAGCNNSDNVVIGGVQGSTFTPFIQFDNINSVISGTIQLRNADGSPNGSRAQVVIITDRPAMCDRLAQHPDYFRNPYEAFQAMILFLPATNHLGTFFLLRASAAGTGSELFAFKPTQRDAAIANTGKAAPPFIGAGTDSVGNPTYISLTDWTETTSGQTTGSFYLNYTPPAPLTSNGGFPFSGKFKASGCPTLDGTLLP